MAVLIGTGDGSFEPAVNFEVGVSPTSVAVDDLDGDGIEDLVVTTNRDSNDVVV